MECKVTPENNFNVWKSFELLTKYRDIIITFINNHILDSIETQSVFFEIFNEYENMADVFYNNLVSIYTQTEVLGEDEGLSFDINYIQQKYILTRLPVAYNKRTFALNFLNLLPAYKNLVFNLIGGVKDAS